MNDYLWMQQGWLCPRCNVVNAPYAMFCAHCMPPNVTTAPTTGTNPNPLPTVTTAAAQKPKA
jgi:hypothetical protein